MLIVSMQKVKKNNQYYLSFGKFILDHARTYMFLCMKIPEKNT